MNHETEDVTQHIQDFAVEAPSAQREHLRAAHEQTRIGALDWEYLGHSHALLHEGPAQPANPLEERARGKRVAVRERDLADVRDMLSRLAKQTYKENFGAAEVDSGVYYVVTDNGTLVKITVELA